MAVTVQASVGGRKVVASSSLVVSDTNEFELNLLDSCLVFELREDKGNSRVESVSVNEDNARIALYNFGKTRSTSIEWARLITHQNHDYDLALTVETVKSNSVYIVHYTVMMSTKGGSHA